MSEVAKVDNGKKKIEAMIETMVMNKPNLRELVSVASVWNYMQLPDSSFGWTLNSKMSDQAKALAVMAHIEAGAQPGYGHIYFLGNKLYQSAAFIQQKANADPNFKVCGEAKFEPFTDGEKEMFGIEDGDMACRVTMTVDAKGEKMTVVGHGIIGKDELSRNKPGLSSRKNRAMTLKTRAMRDLLSRFYPSTGIPVGPDVSEEAEAVQSGYSDQMKLANTSEESRKEMRGEIIEAELEKVEAATKEEAMPIFKSLSEKAKEKGILQKDLLGAADLKTVKSLLELDSKEVFRRLEIMSDFVEAAD